MGQDEKRGPGQKGQRADMCRGGRETGGREGKGAAQTISSELILTSLHAIIID